MYPVFIEDKNSVKENRSFKKDYGKTIEAIIKPLYTEETDPPSYRIETERILSEWNIVDSTMDISVIPQNIYDNNAFKEIADKYKHANISKDKLIASIINYRNKSFHNGIPDSGTFADGIKLLVKHLKPENQPEWANECF